MRRDNKDIAKSDIGTTYLVKGMKCLSTPVRLITGDERSLGMVSVCVHAYMLV